ncbi:hypothetical protein [Nocardioides hwasunensis]|uniref:DUF222 domain-containing protein n=1 Tax=Nocardioides hwasunensis TaxID=397258 RepID=A0ABR8MJA6_9ACTN|nr:hypothetical protein [Nocardioides hwasunensis]MBD3916008.1 hypothetical protein [Nocardioides hwasunensis]
MAEPTTLPQPPDAAGGASARELLELASQALRARRMGEVAEIELAIQWAVIHGQPRDDRDPMVEPAGNGTPALREHAIPELAMARETHPLTTRALIADGLDLAHRLPLTWAVVRAGECEPWVARKVATITRGVTAESIGTVDRAVSRAIRGHAPSTVLEIARAKAIEADPEGHAAAREQARRARYVTLSRADEHGYRCVIAKVTAGDAAWIDAMVERVAQILRTTLGADHNHDELRSVALGWLARPVELLKLLLEHTEIGTDDETGEVVRPAWMPEDALATVERFCTLPARRLARLRNRGQLFVHVSEAVLRAGRGVARVEGVGPVDVRQLHEVLGNAEVTVTPVLDLRGRRRVDAYEHPEDVKDHVWLQTGGDCFPFTPRTAVRDGVDFDHAVPYRSPDTGGSPGQTGPHNSGPLRRQHHRTKTFGGYSSRVVGPGRHLWRTPSGLAYLVDHTGTSRIDAEQAETMADSVQDGVEIYVGHSLAYEPA